MVSDSESSESDSLPLSQNKRQRHGSISDLANDQWRCVDKEARIDQDTGGRDGNETDKGGRGENGTPSSAPDDRSDIGDGGRGIEDGGSDFEDGGSDTEERGSEFEDGGSDIHHGHGSSDIGWLESEREDGSDDGGVGDPCEVQGEWHPFVNRAHAQLVMLYHGSHRRNCDQVTFRAFMTILRVILFCIC